MSAPVATVTTAPSATTLASVHRHRPKPWVQANRKVPLSNSRASNGAPRNAPTSAGTTCKMNPFDRNPYLPLKLSISW